MSHFSCNSDAIQPNRRLRPNSVHNFLNSPNLGFWNTGLKCTECAKVAYANAYAVRRKVRTHSESPYALRTFRRTPRILQLNTNDNVDEWPAKSPDLNVIEHLWGIMQELVDEQQPTNKRALVRIVNRVWRGLSDTLLEDLVDSMDRRLQAVIDHDGEFLRGEWY